MSPKKRGYVFYDTRIVRLQQFLAHLFTKTYSDVVYWREEVLKLF